MFKLTFFDSCRIEVVQQQLNRVFLFLKVFQQYIKDPKWQTEVSRKLNSFFCPTIGLTPDQSLNRQFLISRRVFNTKFSNFGFTLQLSEIKFVKNAPSINFWGIDFPFPPIPTTQFLKSNYQSTKFQVQEANWKNFAVHRMGFWSAIVMKMSHSQNLFTLSKLKLLENLLLNFFHETWTYSYSCFEFVSFTLPFCCALEPW